MDLEEQLLGAIGSDAADGNAAYLVCQELGIEPQHFYRDDHGRLFRVIESLWADGDPPLLSLVRERLRREYGAEDGSALYLTYNEYTTRCESVWFARRFAREVLHTWRQREVLRLNADIAAAIHAGDTARVQDAQQHIGELMAAEHATESRLAIPLKELAARDYPEPCWVVDGLLPEGLTLLAGGPKLGKSFLALGLGLSVALGGPALGGYTRALQGQVLYLALEDTEQRIVERAAAALLGEEMPDGLDVAVRWPMLHEGAMARIEQWVKQQSQPRLVIVDTLAVLKGEAPEANGTDLYARDYATMRAFKSLTDRYHLSLVVLHHLRKGSSAEGDPLEEISGTMGLSGAVDNVLVLKRKRNDPQATLFATGRDVDEKQWALRFDPQLLSWTAQGDAAAVQITRERQEVLDQIRESGPVTAKDLADLLGKNYANARQLLARMTVTGHLVKLERGRYGISNPL